MSNIQITENESGKYSPDWFYNEAQIPECISLAHKADELRENFINLFGVAKLKSLSGRELLTSLFYNDEGNKTNLNQMIGNAVPVNLAKYVANALREYISTRERIEE